MKELPQNVRVEIAREAMRGRVEHDRIEEIVKKVREQDKKEMQKRIKRIVYWGVAIFIIYNILAYLGVINFLLK